jgi:hypothetical protein
VEDVNHLQIESSKEVFTVSKLSTFFHFVSGDSTRIKVHSFVKLSARRAVNGYVVHPGDTLLPLASEVIALPYPAL